MESYIHRGEAHLKQSSAGSSLTVDQATQQKEAHGKATHTPGELNAFLTVFFIVVGKILTDQKHSNPRDRSKILCFHIIFVI